MSHSVEDSLKWLQNGTLLNPAQRTDIKNQNQRFVAGLDV